MAGARLRFPPSTGDPDSDGASVSEVMISGGGLEGRAASAVLANMLDEGEAWVVLSLRSFARSFTRALSPLNMAVRCLSSSCRMAASGVIQSALDVLSTHSGISRKRSQALRAYSTIVSINAQYHRERDPTAGLRRHDVRKRCSTNRSGGFIPTGVPASSATTSPVL